MVVESFIMWQAENATNEDWGSYDSSLGRNGNVKYVPKASALDLCFGMLSIDSPDQIDKYF